MTSKPEKEFLSGYIAGHIMLTIGVNRTVCEASGIRDRGCELIHVGRCGQAICGGPDSMLVGVRCSSGGFIARIESVCKGEEYEEFSSEHASLGVPYQIPCLPIVL